MMETLAVSERMDAPDPESAWLPLRKLPLDLNGPTAVPFTPLDAGAEERPLFELFHSVAVRYPDRVAADDGIRQLTYRQVWENACGLGERIAATVPEGRPVAVLLPNDAFYAVAVLGCLAAGRPSVFLDRHYPAERNLDIIRDAHPAAVIVEASDLREGIWPSDIATITINPARMPQASAPPATGALRTDDPAFIIYTSGSTGQPKGIVLSQRTAIHRAHHLICSLHIGSADKVLSLTSPATIGGIQQIFEAMLPGATLVKHDLRRMGIGSVLRLIEDRQVTMLFATPSLLRALARLKEAPAKLASLRAIQAAGEVLLRTDLTLLRTALPRDCYVLVVYGATEAPGLLQWFVPRDHDPDDPRVAAGYPVSGCDYAILNDAARPVPPGDTGELVVRSRYTALGEWCDGCLVSGRFTADPGDPTLRVYNTGDLVRLRPDGVFLAVGRGDRQVKIGGNRVEPAEIEDILRGAPNVLDAAVVARPTGDEAILIAFVVPQIRGVGDLVSELRAELRAALPAHMQPARIALLDALPLLPGGKVDEQALLTLEAPGATGTAPPTGDGSAFALAAVTGAWTRILTRSSLERDLSFEEAGGDSLRLLQFAFRLEEHCGLELPLELFHLGLRPSDFVRALDHHLQTAPVDEPIDDRLETEPADERPTVFLIPAFGGYEPRLARFSADCRHTVRIVAINYGDWPELLRPDITFETIITDTINRILARAPSGPLRILGYSAGGHLAYAVAVALSTAGRSVKFLGILDTDLTERKPERLTWRHLVERRRWARLVQNLRHDLWGEMLSRILPVPLFQLPATRWLLRCLISLRLIKLPISVSYRLHHHLGMSLRLALLRSWRRADFEQPLDARCFLFRAERTAPHLPDDLGWRHRCPTVTVIPMTGTHRTMFDDPHRALLSARFIEAVQQASRAAPAVPVVQPE